MNITFTAYCKPQSQGSIKSFTLVDKIAVATLARAISSRVPGYDKLVEMITAVAKATRSILTSDNPELKAYRKQVGTAASKAMFDANAVEPMAPKHVPVEMVLEFVFVKPESVKKRGYPVVKPDIDKLIRAALDAVCGILYADDAQVVNVSATKNYGPAEYVKISAHTMEATPMLPLQQLPLIEEEPF